jgi:hypothetical protein
MNRHTRRTINRYLRSLRKYRRPMIKIEIDGVVFGNVDPDKLTIEDQIALEEARGAKALVEWMKTHAGTTDEQAAKLVKLPLRKVKELSSGIAEALVAALELPNE